MEANDPRWPYVEMEDYQKASEARGLHEDKPKIDLRLIYFEGDLYQTNDTDVIACHTLPNMPQPMWHKASC